MALDKLPNFLAAPNSADGKPGPHLQCSIHLNCESVEVLEEAYMEGQQGRPSSRSAKPAVLHIMEKTNICTLHTHEDVRRCEFASHDQGFTDSKSVALGLGFMVMVFHSLHQTTAIYFIS